jgi:hypothetical protein
MTAPQQQKLKIAGPVVVTANRTTDGAVVYWTRAAAWTNDLGAAAVVTNATDAGALLAAAKADDVKAIDAYVAPVMLGPDGRARPGNLRERIRLAGPTVPLPSETAV